MLNTKGIIDEDALNIYPDGSSSPNRQRNAGIGIVFVTVDSDGNEVAEDYCPVGYKQGTIDEMELLACIEAIKEANIKYDDLTIFSKIIVFSDSMYVCDNVRNATFNWPKTKWKTVGGSPVKNYELWKKLTKIIEKTQIKIEFQWIKGHAKNPHNKKADKLAKESSLSPFNKPLSDSSTTKKWSPHKTIRGSIEVQGQELLIRIISRKNIPPNNIYEYRYEVIDKDSKWYQRVDFIFYDDYLSRNKCIRVKLNDEEGYPKISQIIKSIDCDKYKN